MLSLTKCEGMLKSLYVELRLPVVDVLDVQVHNAFTTSTFRYLQPMRFSDIRAWLALPGFGSILIQSEISVIYNSVYHFTFILCALGHLGAVSVLQTLYFGFAAKLVMQFILIRFWSALRHSSVHTWSLRYVIRHCVNQNFWTRLHVGPYCLWSHFISWMPRLILFAHKAGRLNSLISFLEERIFECARAHAHTQVLKWSLANKLVSPEKKKPPHGISFCTEINP